MDSEHECENFNLCGEKIPLWMRRCTKCDIEFGKWNGGKGNLKEYPDNECPICLNTKTCFEQPRCEHLICDDCFRVLYFGEIPQDIIESKIGKEPEHPYQHILDQFKNLNIDYDEIESDPETYPLITEWKIKEEIWLNLKESVIEELSTRKCCLCRITNY